MSAHLQRDSLDATPDRNGAARPARQEREPTGLDAARGIVVATAMGFGLWMLIAATVWAVV
jgi:hypothetical protein